MDMVEHPFLLTMLVILNVPCYLYLLRGMFGDSEGIKESLMYMLTPDFISALRGRFWDDKWAEMKLFAFVLACALVVGGEYALIVNVVYGT